MTQRYVARRALVKAAGVLAALAPLGALAALAPLGALVVLAPSGARADDGRVRLALLGDSLTAGFGLDPEDAFPARLAAALAAAGRDVVVLDAGVSGDTTAGGLARLDWVLGDAPDVVLVELGANDALRGLPPAEARANLDAILRTLGDRGVAAVLTGMKAPRNLGDDYVAAFDGLYPDLAQRHGVPLYPFFLEGVALDPALSQDDGLHPNAQGVIEIVRRILPTLLPVIDRARAD